MDWRSQVSRNATVVDKALVNHQRASDDFEKVVCQGTRWLTFSILPTHAFLIVERRSCFLFVESY